MYFASVLLLFAIVDLGVKIPPCDVVDIIVDIVVGIKAVDRVASPL